jgi:hypothetical protein
MRWFFTFANKNNGIIKNTLARKPTHVKKWRRRWMVVRFIRTVNQDCNPFKVVPSIGGSLHEINSKPC